MARLLAWLLLLAGIAGFAIDFARVPAADVRQRAEGEFWSATDAAGAILSMPRQLGGVTLQPGDSLRLDRLPADTRWTTLGLQLQSLARGAVVEIALGSAGTAAVAAPAAPATDAIVLAVVADEPLGVFLVARHADGSQSILAQAQLAQALKNAFTPFRVRVQHDGARLEVLVEGRSALSVQAPDFAAGIPAVGTRGGAACVRSVLVAERGTTPGAAARSWHDEFHSLAVDTPWGARATGLLLALAALGAAAVLLRALCLAAPTRRAFLDALVLCAAPPAAPFAALLAVDVPRGTLVPLATGLLLAGLCAALWRLRVPLHAAPREPTREAGRRAAMSAAWGRVATCAALVTALLALGLATRFSLATRIAERADFAAAQRAARQASVAPPFVSTGPTVLDAGNALVVPVALRDGDLSAHLQLAPDSILEVRCRADAPPAPQGIALWVPSDARLSCSFVRETAADCAEVGTSAPAVAPGRDLELRVTLRGGRLHAEVGGAVLDATEFAGRGSALLLLAARGSATLSELRVQPAPPDDATAGLTAAWATPALAPLLFLLLATAALAWLAPVRGPAALALASLALLPLAAGLHAVLAEDSGRLLVLERTAFGMTLVLALPALVHARSLAAPRLLALLAVAALLPLLAVGALAADRRAFGGVTSTGYDDTAWSGDALPADLAWLRHPLLRLLDDYLGAHRFRDRQVAVAKAPGTRRVVALGGSSTWGFGLAPELHAEYPAVLERLLADGAPAGEHVEVLNAAWRGATGARLLRFLRDGLQPFAPDVVTLSLTYNDSFALTRADEDGRLSAACAPGASRGVLDDLRGARELQRGDDALTALLVARRTWTGSTAALWQRLGNASSPPARFEAILRQFAALARERGFRLVLIKEPVAGDAPLAWKEEFRAVIDRVGADCGVPVVDPTPELAAHGGAELFQDAIHPRPAGHELIARALLPVVREALKR